MARTSKRTRYAFSRIHGDISMDQTGPLKTWAGRIIVGHVVHQWEVFCGVGPMLSAKGIEMSVLAAKRQMVRWHRKLSGVAR